MTCDPEVVHAAGVRQDVRRRLVMLKQTLPLGQVVASKEIQRFCSRERDRHGKKEHNARDKNIHLHSVFDVPVSREFDQTRRMNSMNTHTYCSLFYAHRHRPVATNTH